jgi:hypothetical protein
MTMVIDLAVMTYHNALRVQGWIGDLALVIEHELFGEDSLKVKLCGQFGPQFNGFTVEEALRRLREHLLPVWERANQQLIRNLEALRRPQRGGGAHSGYWPGGTGQCRAAAGESPAKRRPVIPTC